MMSLFLSSKRFTKGDCLGKSAGFTIIELVIVLAIVAILVVGVGASSRNWMAQQSLQNAVYQLNGDLFQAKSLAIKNNQNCDVNFNVGTNQYTLSIGNRTIDLADYHGGVRLLGADPGGTPSSALITYTPRGLCNNPGQVFLTNNDNLVSYRIRTSAAGGISTQVWNSSTGQYVKY